MFGASSNTGGGLFGTSNTSNNASGGGLFGNKPAAPTNTGLGFGQSNTAGQANSTGGGLFGQSQNNSTNAPSGGLFGSNQQKPVSGGLFGASQTTNSTNTGGFGASNSGSGAGSMFGKPAGTSTTGGGLFGSNQQQGTSAGGLFGGNQSNTVPSGGGLFGNNQQSNTGTSGGLFGNKQQNTGTGGGLFGGNQQSSGTNTGGLFGGNQQSTASGGLFGNKPSAPSGGGLFGSSNNNTQMGGGLFGSKPTASGGLFGGQPPPPPPQQQQQQSNLFSNTTNSQQPSFSWSQPQQSQPAVNNVTTLGGFGQNTNQPQATNPAAYTPAVNDQLAKVYEQWDPNSSKCALKTHFYNKFSDQEMNVLMSQPRPANETPEDWDKAMTERPGPNYFPIKITSYDEVAQRIETQLDYAAREKIVLNQINERLNTLSAKHDLENTTRILKAKARHTQLSRRLLRLATILAMLKLKGYPLLPEEEEIAKQFDILTNKLNDPNSPIGKVGDISAKLAILKERAEEMNTQFDKSIHVLNESFESGGASKGRAKEDLNNPNDVIEKISQILLKQQMGLNYLNEVLRKDEEKVEKIVSSRK
ncbi:NUP57 [Candida margitis]|uniref:NUP57 n=1 Tax=Candida margitis TaxID=1775924 RepID=UPI002227A5D9|nr:NUP57 [Candida margitis]KAI5960703.1 NUP57 [Candida margitis]